MQGLTERQSRFLAEYVKCGQGAEAARQAGYAATTASKKAGELLRNPKIQKSLAALLAEADQTRIADGQEVLRTLTEAMRSPSAEWRDRIRAAELLGKRHLLFTDRVAVSVEESEWFKNARVAP